MRALNIVFFILMLSISTATVNAVLGPGSVPSVQGPDVNASVSDIVNNETGGIKDAFTLTYRSLGVFFDIVQGALLLGNTVQALSPWPLPNAIVNGLNVLSLAAVAIAVIQFARGVLLSGGE